MDVGRGVLLSVLLGVTAACAQDNEPAKVAAYLKTVPEVNLPATDEAKREALVTSAILCSDHLQEPPANRDNYLWVYQKAPQLLDSYDHNRAFFGCGSWHDAVGATWMMISILKQDRNIRVASDIKDVATTHFRKPNADGEYDFFTGERPAPGMPNFERPYGYEWLIKLYGEVKSGSSEDDKKMATAIAPLAKWMSERLVFYLYDLKYPYRTGAEANTAWGISLALDGANLSENQTLKTSLHDNAIRLFGKDKNCATSFEPQNSDLVSPCLTEAALMGRVMAEADYLKWLDGFLPPVHSDAFQIYARPIDISHSNLAAQDAQLQQIAEAHLVGLYFQRAAGMMTISYALPKDDARVAVLRRLAAQNAEWGYQKISVGGYDGQHFLSTYAVLYENAAKGPAPLAPPEKAKAPANAEGQ